MFIYTCMYMYILDACMKAGKVKRQVWTDTAIEAFSEGLCQVLYNHNNLASERCTHHMGFMCMVHSS